jgi:hypothetical protein
MRHVSKPGDKKVTEITRSTTLRGTSVLRMNKSYGHIHPISGPICHICTFSHLFPTRVTTRPLKRISSATNMCIASKRRQHEMAAHKQNKFRIRT